MAFAFDSVCSLSLVQGRPGDYGQSAEHMRLMVQHNDKWVAAVPWLARLVLFSMHVVTDIVKFAGVLLSVA